MAEGADRAESAGTAESTDSWYRALQLERDPFAAPGPFFPGGGRQGLLQQIVQQLHFSGGGVVLVGEAGSGVSTLLDAALGQLTGVADTLLISADDIPSPAALWAALADAAISRPAGGIDGADTWLAARRQSGPRDGSALPLVLAVDDAQRLIDPVLQHLLQLERTASTELRLLLGAEPELVPRLSAGPGHRLGLRLPALDRAATADYVLTRLQTAGYVGELPLDDLQLDTLWQHSGGIPGRAHALLPPLLASPPPAVSAQTLRRLPVIHLLGVAGLITAVAIGLLYWGGADREPDKRGAEWTPLQLPAPGAGEAVSSTDPVAGAVGRGQREDDSSLSFNNPAVKEGPVGGEQVKGASRASPAATGKPLAESLEEKPQEPVQKQLRQRVQEQPRQQAAAEVAQTAVPAASAQQVAAQPVAAQPVATDRDRQGALSADERGLLELPAGSYVLQLFAAHDPQRVAGFARDTPADLRIYQFETRLNGAPWYVAVTGPYANDAAARAAVARLPAAMRSAKPWPRTQADVAQAIRNVRGISD